MIASTIIKRFMLGALAFKNTVPVHQEAGAPGVGDDVTAGFYIGARWHNITTPATATVYECIDPAEGAAIWRALN